MSTDISISAENVDFVRWFLAFGGAVAVAGVAFRTRSLSAGGAVAAVVLGATLVGMAGWWSGVLLVAFFVTSSVLSRAGAAPSARTTQRGSRRDAVQVFANGGVALVCAIGYGWSGHHLWLVALAGSLAAANADTWSTEIGRTSPFRPRLVTTGRRVPGGTSGAVSCRGLAAALGGGLLIGVFAAIGARFAWFELPTGALAMLLLTGIAGLAGSLLDSVLGATVQDSRWCDTCDTKTERRVHRCGRRTRSIAGVSWITNDVVNLACTLGGAVVAALLFEFMA